MDKQEEDGRDANPRASAILEDNGRDDEGNKQEDGRDEQADFIPLRSYPNRRGVPTVDDWLVRSSEWPHQNEAVWFSRRA